MTLHRIRLTMASPSATRWRADTFFGHLCWAMAYQEGDQALQGFLAASAGSDPPLVLSDGFPADLLPKPVQLPKGAKNEQMTRDQELQDYRAWRKVKDREWLTLNEFNAVINGQLRDLGAKPDMPAWWRNGWQVTWRNTIRRDTGTTGGPGEGGLHAHSSFFWKEVTFYARLGPAMPGDRLQRLLRYLETSGYGKEKSRGMGQVRSATIEAQPFQGFKPPAKPNGFVTLSTFVPAENDPTDGAWRILVKYGKVSEGFSTVEHPFKRPLIMLEPGAVFRTTGSPREWYGRMVPDTYPDIPGVQQYGLALAVPMVVQEASVYA